MIPVADNLWTPLVVWLNASLYGTGYHTCYHATIHSNLLHMLSAQPTHMYMEMYHHNTNQDECYGRASCKAYIWHGVLCPYRHLWRKIECGLLCNTMGIIFTMGIILNTLKHFLWTKSINFQRKHLLLYQTKPWIYRFCRVMWHPSVYWDAWYIWLCIVKYLSYLCDVKHHWISIG